MSIPELPVIFPLYCYYCERYEFQLNLRLSVIYAGLSIVWAEDYNLALSEPLSNISLAGDYTSLCARLSGPQAQGSQGLLYFNLFTHWTLGQRPHVH